MDNAPPSTPQTTETPQAKKARLIAEVTGDVQQFQIDANKDGVIDDVDQTFVRKELEAAQTVEELDSVMSGFAQSFGEKYKSAVAARKTERSVSGTESTDTSEEGMNAIMEKADSMRKGLHEKFGSEGKKSEWIDTIFIAISRSIAQSFGKMFGISDMLNEYADSIEKENAKNTVSGIFKGNAAVIAGHEKLYNAWIDQRLTNTGDKNNEIESFSDFLKRKAKGKNKKTVGIEKLLEVVGKDGKVTKTAEQTVEDGKAKAEALHQKAVQEFQTGNKDAPLDTLLQEATTGQSTRVTNMIAKANAEKAALLQKNAGKTETEKTALTQTLDAVITMLTTDAVKKQATKGIMAKLDLKDAENIDPEKITKMELNNTLYKNFSFTLTKSALKWKLSIEKKKPTTKKLSDDLEFSLDKAGEKEMVTFFDAMKNANENGSSDGKDNFDGLETETYKEAIKFLEAPRKARAKNKKNIFENIANVTDIHFGETIKKTTPLFSVQNKKLQMTLQKDATETTTTKEIEINTDTLNKMGFADLESYANYLNAQNENGAMEKEAGEYALMSQVSKKITPKNEMKYPAQFSFEDSGKIQYEKTDNKKATIDLSFSDDEAAKKYGFENKSALLERLDKIRKEEDWKMFEKS